MAGAASDWWRFGKACAALPVSAVRFELRRRLPRAPRAARLPVGDVADRSGLFAHLDGIEKAQAEARERELRERYALAPLRASMPRRDYGEASDLVDALDRAAPDILGSASERPCHVVDVGARNWSYVEALERFFSVGLAHRRAPGLEELIGVEIDGHGRYADGSCRADHARAYARRAGERAGADADVRYEVADFRTWRGVENGSVDVVTMFFPFVLRFPLLAWGLPLYLFDPAGIVQRALDLLAPGGRLVTLHQNRAERDAWTDLLGALPIEVVRARKAPARLVSGVWRDRHLVVARTRGPASGNSP